MKLSKHKVTNSLMTLDIVHPNYILSLHRLLTLKAITKTKNENLYRQMLGAMIRHIALSKKNSKFELWRQLILLIGATTNPKQYY